MTIKYVLFDNNGVLTTNHKENVDADLAKVAGVSKKKMHNAVLKHCVPLDKGLISDVEFSRRILNTVGSNIAPELLTKTRLNAYHPKKEVMKFATQLSKRHSIGLLSNFGKEFKYADRKWKILRIFDSKRTFLSCEMGMCKPNKNIYREVIRKLKCKPAQIIFIDDNYDNIISSRACGINSIHYKSLSGLKKDLLRYDIK